MEDNKTDPDSTKEAGDNPQKSFPATNGDVIPKSGLWAYLAELVLAGAVGTGIWLFGEHLISHGHTTWGSVVSFVAFCFYFATVPITAIKIWARPKLIWPLFVGFCSLMALVFTLSSRQHELKPHFILSLQIDDSATALLLTNDFLFHNRMENVGNLPNGSIIFKGRANGCLVVPVQPGESNKIFRFIIENDSPVKVTDLEVVVGFPKGWKCGLDSTKWHEVGQHFIIPGWKIVITNLQFWGAQSPYPLFATDSLTFPSITNFSVPVYSSPSTEEGLIELTIRSTGFERLFVAGMIFVPVTSNSFKPFVAQIQQGTNDVFHLTITTNEFEDSQK